MAGYRPLKIAGMTTGLVQSREQFILPNDAYPVLENAFVWRERIKRKQGYELLGRLRRVFVDESLGLSGASPWTFNALSAVGIRGNITNITNFNPGVVTTAAPHNLVNNQTVLITGVNGMTQVNGLTVTITVVTPTSFSIGVDTTAFGVYTSGGFWTLSNQPNVELECGSLIITIQAGPDIVFTDQGDGTLTSPTPGNSGTVNYVTGSVTLTHTAGAGVPTIASFNYYPVLPVMGLRSRELNNINSEQTVAFDQIYAYIFGVTGWQEFIPGTTWTGNDSDFFWTTNYWVDNPTAANNRKIFWETNNSGVTGDPIRFTNGVTWQDFSAIQGQINAAGDFLNQALAILPFRGRLLMFNTFEGPTLATSVQFRQRIRWSAIGTPFSVAAGFIGATNINPDAWRDDIRGQGGFLDIPTAENIVAVGFVRDNLVIYCERSTWQLRYTGRTISPFQIEKVNTELGAESTFSAVQFDTSLVGIGDKGIVECDSFKSNRIDIKIPDLVFQFNNEGNGTKRVHGIRDFVQRLAYWTYPYVPNNGPPIIYPNRRLVYNYENDSWAIFTDSLTTLGTFQPQLARSWATTPFSWETQNYSWINRPSLIPLIIGGNQQGYVLYLDQQVTNDRSLTIHNITGNVTTPTVITSPNHNLLTGQVITVKNIAPGTAFDNLNDQHFGIVRLTANTFELWVYDPSTGQFSIPQLDPMQVYIGCGEMCIRDNFRVISKKFNFLDEGNNIQLGYVDVLLEDTEDGAISMYAYLNYNEDQPVNILPQNNNQDPFFNSVVPTTNPGGLDNSKNWQRVYCAVNGTFVTIEWTLSNGQLVGPEQENNVQIDAQILWMRKAGTNIPAMIN